MRRLGSRCTAPRPRRELADVVNLGYVDQCRREIRPSELQTLRYQAWEPLSAGALVVAAQVLVARPWQEPGRVRRRCPDRPRHVSKVLTSRESSRSTWRSNSKPRRSRQGSAFFTSSRKNQRGSNSLRTVSIDGLCLRGRGSAKQRLRGAIAICSSRSWMPYFWTWAGYLTVEEFRTC